MANLSAIVPTFRRPEFLRRALASIANQTSLPCEVIVVDDDPSSLTATQALAESSGLDNVRTARNHRTPGASGARNSGMDIARGEFLAFLDDDDEWQPRFVAQAAACCREHALDLLCVDVINCLPDGAERPGKTAPEGLQAEAFLTRNPGFLGSNVLIRRSCLIEVGGFDESLPSMNDIDLGWRLSQCQQLRYRPLHERLVRHHLHTGSRLSTPRSEAKRQGVRRFFELHAPHMTAAQRLTYRAKVLRLWGVDEYGQVVSEGKP